MTIAVRRPIWIPAAVWDAARARAAERETDLATVIEQALRMYASAGKSGAMGGRASAQSLSQSERSRRAAKAAAARWGKARDSARSVSQR